MKMSRLLSGVVLLLCGCSDVDNAVNKTTTGAEIHWHKGQVDSAFAMAREENMPLFFYWGAEWCPPCQEIKNTVFKHPKFVSLSQLFVPVYLDGDTEQAQLVGEQFAVQGYPTMIVFNSAGKEITRIPGGIDTRRYLDVLALSLNNGKQMNELIAEAASKPEALSSEDLTQLAFYSWGQDNLPIGTEDTLALLKGLAFLNRPPDELAIARLLLSYLAVQTDLDLDHLNPSEKLTAASRLQDYLQHSDTVLANIDYLSFYADKITKLLALPAEQQQSFISQWQTSVAQQRDNPLLSKAEKLGTWMTPVSFFWLQYPDADSIPPPLADNIQAAIATVNSNTEGDERQSVINRAGNVLRAAKLYPQARELIQAELALSKSPYYFMSSMAEIAEETGNYEDSVDWRRRAYEAAKGKATRFQWGVEYASALIQYQPQNGEEIKHTASALFDNLDQGGDVFTGRNYGRLNTLLDNLQQWQSEARTDTLADFIGQLQTLCDQTDPESPTRQQCQRLMAEY